jgi:hypothetical protein
VKKSAGNHHHPPNHSLSPLKAAVTHRHSPLGCFTQVSLPLACKGCQIAGKEGNKGEGP